MKNLTETLKMISEMIKTSLMNGCQSMPHLVEQ
jgi:hypothetical protein